MHNFAGPKTKRSEQVVQNLSFDEDYKVLVFEGLAHDGQNLTRIESKDTQVKVVEDGGYTYVCKAAAGTAESAELWKVFRVDSTGNKMYADGDANFDNTATDPTNLSYSYT